MLRAASGSVATDLGLVQGAVNMGAVEKNPEMRRISEAFSKNEMQTPDLAANTVVALYCEENASYLSGRYVDSQQDLGEVLDEARKGRDGRIKRDNLYCLKMEEL